MLKFYQGDDCHMEWYYFLFIILGLIIIFLVVMYFQFLNTFTMRKKLQSILLPDGTYAKYLDTIKDSVSFFENAVEEEVCIQSFDNIKLKGHLFECPKSKKVLIFFHGFKSSYKTDLTNAKQYIDRGYSVLAVEQRGHGGSEGKFITFGVLERYDCKSWSQYVVGRFGEDVEILLVGVSMGASTIMMAADLNLPVQVKGMIADCGFINPKQEISYCIKHYYHLPVFPFVNILDLYCRIFAKFSLSEASCDKALSASNIPILMVHGDKDDFVPYSCSVVNYAACFMEKKDFLTVKCDIHAASYLENTELYLESVNNFLNSINF